MFLNIMSNYVDILGSVSKKCPRLFSDFIGNSRARKPNKTQTKQGNIIGLQYVCTYQQAVIFRLFSFILY